MFFVFFASSASSEIAFIALSWVISFLCIKSFTNSSHSKCSSNFFILLIDVFELNFIIFSGILKIPCQIQIFYFFFDTTPKLFNMFIISYIRLFLTPRHYVSSSRDMLPVLKFLYLSTKCSHSLPKFLSSLFGNLSCCILNNSSHDTFKSWNDR